MFTINNMLVFASNEEILSYILDKKNDVYRNQILEISQNLCDGEKERLLKTHNTIMTLNALSDHCEDEDLIDFWENMSDKEQIEFLSNFIDHQYFYIYDRIEESYSVKKIDAIKQKAADRETKKIIKLLIEKKDEKLIFEILNLIKERFFDKDEFFEKLDSILANTELLYYNMPRNRFENLKKDNLPPKEEIISKATDKIEIIEELQFFLYCTFFRYAKKVNFEDLETHLPKKIKIYSVSGHGEINKKLNKLWDSIK